MNIAQMLFNKARQVPESPALSADGVTVSFGSLAGKVARMAGALRGRLELGSGDRVVLWMDNRIEFVETLFACWAAGLCVVPVNFKLHPRELAHIVRDAGACWVFASAELAAEGAAHWPDGEPPRFVAVESPAYAAMNEGEAIAAQVVGPDDLAWIFYTSGTTGFPKGAMLSHRNLLFMSMTYYADIEQVAPGQAMIHAAPLSHGSGQYMLPHLLAGGHQLILPRFDPDEVLGLMQLHEAVSMFMVPTMITRLVQVLKLRGAWQGNISHIIYGGAPMYVADLLEAMRWFGPCFYQLYGQGETPMTATGLDGRHHRRALASGDTGMLATSGTPRTGVEVRVVDDEGRDVAPGELGEIITRSDCVMLGYWNNEAATASALREGWLWTGDLGTLDERGYLTLRDRSKDLIISGGTNIYPREIEEVLLTHPAIVECSVVGRAHADMGEEAVAFIVCHPDASVSAGELDTLCLGRIARFKRPRAYYFIDALPKSAYGKILKKTLREKLKDARFRSTPVAAP